LYFLGALAPALLILSIVRILRRAGSAPPPGTFLQRVDFGYGCSRLAFVAAALIHLTAWLAALALGAQVGAKFFEAFILTTVAWILTSLMWGCVMNLALAIRGPAGEAASP
jgi:hypothetical protein